MSRILLKNSFKHPSNQSLKTQFNEPTVSELISITEMPSHTEEALATSYLNSLIAKTNADNDTSKWTAFDRKAALWHLYIETMEDPIITYNYKCGHCGNNHFADVDFTQLDVDITLQNQIDPFPCDISINKKIYNVELMPLTGEDMERLEQAWPSLEIAKESGDEARVSREKIELQLIYSACVLRFKDDDKSFDEKLALLRSASIKEYAAITHAQLAAFEEQRHGLNSEYKDGRLYLVSPALECDEQEGKSTRLLMPFRPSDFIPTI